MEIIISFYKVYNVLGYGFLEKVICENQEVGDYYADVIVNDLIILEIKAAEGLRDENKAQLINCLKERKYQK